MEAGAAGTDKRRRSSRLKRKRRNTELEQEDHPRSQKMSRPNEEAVAGSVSAPVGVDFTMDQLTKWMNNEFRTAINKDIDNSIKGLSARVDKNQEEFRTHRDRVDRELQEMRNELQSQSNKNPPVANYVSAATSGPSRPQHPAPAPVLKNTSRQAEQFWRSRRSSRVFPCLLYTSPSPRDLSTSRMPSSA